MPASLSPAPTPKPSRKPCSNSGTTQPFRKNSPPTPATALTNVPNLKPPPRHVPEKSSHHARRVRRRHPLDRRLRRPVLATVRPPPREKHRRPPPVQHLTAHSRTIPN